MMIRNGFVTNSSSTNYIILSKGELTPEKLADLLGVREQSTLYSQVLDLARNLLVRDYLRPSDEFVNAPFEEQLLDIFGEKTLKKYRKLSKKGYVVYCGRINDDYEEIEAMLTIDSFIVSSKNIYMDFSDGSY